MENKKKIGILTMYYTNISHGGLLQAYSLCKKLDNLGYCTEQIKYDYNERFRVNSIFGKIKRLIRTIPYKFLLLFTGDKSEQKYYSYMDEVPHSELYNSNNIETLNGKYDIYVVGSDQVWNELYCDDYFYFPEIKNPKVAYAASVGRDNLTEKELKSIANKISDFKAVSVRESDLQEKLQKFARQEVELVCDPVFLNSKEFWIEHSVKPDIKEKYVLVYILGDDISAKKKAVSFAKQLGYKVVTIPNVNLAAHFSDVHGSDIVKWSVGPKEFLGLINNAECVLTDSFHCTAFSIIFQKNFYCFDRSGGEKKMNSRLLSILNVIGMPERFIDINKTGHFAFNDIEYGSVGEKLCCYITKSEKWLKQALE